MDYKNILPIEKVNAMIHGLEKPKAEFGKTLSESFNFLFNDFGNQILICLFLFLCSFLPFLWPFIMGGWYIYIHKKRHEQHATFSDIFLGFQHFGPLLVLALIQTLLYLIIFGIAGGIGYLSIEPMIGDGINDEDMISLVMVVCILAAIPFYYFINIIFFFSTFFVIFANMGTTEAIRASFQLGMKHFWALFLIVLVAGMIAGLGANFCYIGLPFTYPFGFIAFYIYFEQFFDIQAEKDEMDSIIEHLV